MTNSAVRYFSKSGHTKKIADAIAKAAGCDAKAIPAPINEPVDILFLGSSVYWAGISAEVKNYIKSLDKTKIGKVVVFSTSGLALSADSEMFTGKRDSRGNGKFLLPRAIYRAAPRPPESGGPESCCRLC